MYSLRNDIVLYHNYDMISIYCPALSISVIVLTYIFLQRRQITSFNKWAFILDVSGKRAVVKMRTEQWLKLLKIR